MLNRAGAYRRNRDYDAELRHWAPLVRKTALHLSLTTWCRPG